MRRFMILPMAALLTVTVAGSAMAGPSVTNSSGSGESIYGEWQSEGTYGYVMIGEENGSGAFGEIYQESGSWVECRAEAGGAGVSGAPSTHDAGPGEEPYGFVGTRTSGRAFDLEVTLSRKLEMGTATGSVELYTETVDECNGMYGRDAVAEIATITVSATGVGSRATVRGSGADRIPSEFNGHDRYRGAERQASGSVRAGSVIDAAFDWGYMNSVTWRMHANQ